MKRNGKLFVALHALIHLELKASSPVTSEVLGSCLATNPVVVRRTLGLLRDRGILRSVKGPGGGWVLARPAAEVSLREICDALDEEIVGLLDPPSEAERCLIIRSVSGVMDPLLRDIRALVSERLAKITLADLATDVSARALVALPTLQEATNHGS